MVRGIFILLSFFLCSTYVHAQFSIRGKVVNAKDSLPIENVYITINDNILWANSDKNGAFVINNIPKGKYIITTKILGFIPTNLEKTITTDVRNIVIYLQEDNLKLEDVEINAKRSNTLTTSYLMDRKTLDHLQMLSITDAATLLPGGKTSGTTNLASTSAQRFSVNGKSSEMGNATFGVGVEVDGVRISNNGNRELNGIDTRNISTSNIESIEIITGIPTVEYGDISNGIVKINNRKGQSPYILDLNVSPNNKLVALSKGYNLSKKGGVLNFNLEHLKSISNLASPYTTYNRNSAELNYSNIFNAINNQPITINFGISGNIGGYNSESDPDRFVNTYDKSKDNTIRANYSLKWLLNKPYITNIETSGSLSYNNKLSETSTNKSASSSVAANHALNEGYVVGQTYLENPNANLILIPRGYWYEVNYTDSKLLNFSNKIKANLFKKINNSHNNFMIGADFSRSGNLGEGNYYADYQYAPTWRPYVYNQESFVNNYAFFAENNLSIPINNKDLVFTAGVRNDITSIAGSEYGNVSSLSPRGNLKYTFIDNGDHLVKNFDVKLGWGKTVKLPSFNVLYSIPTYNDILTFSPGTTANGETYYAYYSLPITRVFNNDLKWQYNIQKEIAFNLNLGGNKIFIAASTNKTFNPYTSISVYTPFTYKFTSQANLEQSLIPTGNRVYNVDNKTGIVTVTDKTGVLPNETLSYTEISTLNSRSKYINGSPVTRNGISWIVNFKQIAPIKTSIQLDGNYYYYKGVEETLLAYRPNSTILMSNGQPYKYIGYFSGGGLSANGSLSKSLNLNLTATTHIPKIRLIISARIEGSLYNYSRNLSEYNGKQRGFVIDNASSYSASTTNTDIYAGNQLVGLYPEYYVSSDNMNTKIPFAEMFEWAKTNNTSLYNDLAKLVIKTNYNYYFNENRVSTYFSANIGLTKELGKVASISFNAKNFFNNMGMVSSTLNNSEYSLFDSSSIPKFYYSLSLRLKI